MWTVFLRRDSAWSTRRIMCLSRCRSNSKQVRGLSSARAKWWSVALVVRVWQRLRSGVAMLTLSQRLLVAPVAVISVSGVRRLSCPRLRCQLGVVCIVVDGIVPIGFAVRQRKHGIQWILPGDSARICSFCGFRVFCSPSLAILLESGSAGTGTRAQDLA